VLDDRQWQALCDVMGDTTLAADAILATAAGRLKQVERVEAAVAGWTVSKPATEVMTVLQSHGVPAGVVASSRHLMEEDRQLAHRGYWLRVDHPEIGESRFTAPPFMLDNERVELRRPPLLGEHNEDVLTRILGYAPEQVRALQEQGVLE
jgi:benzylsuccinate CoA-transferase BbsF subunit